MCRTRILLGRRAFFFSFDDRYSMLEFWRWPVAIRYSRLLDRLTDGARAQQFLAGLTTASWMKRFCIAPSPRELDVDDDNEHLEFWAIGCWVW